MDLKDSFYIGYISKTRGLKGEVQLFFEFDDYKALDFDIAFIEIDKKLVPFFVESYKVHPNKTAFLYFEDVDHIDKSKSLVHKKVYLPNDRKPERDPNDFRMTDFIGFIVEDANHGELGTISDIHEFPQQWVAVIPYQGNELMFPINEELLIEIDKENSRLKVNLPDGLIDIYAS